MLHRVSGPEALALALALLAAAPLPAQGALLVAGLAVLRDRDGDRLLQLFIFKEEFLVSASHALLRWERHGPCRGGAPATAHEDGPRPLRCLGGRSPPEGVPDEGLSPGEGRESGWRESGKGWGWPLSFPATGLGERLPAMQSS